MHREESARKALDVAAYSHFQWPRRERRLFQQQITIQCVRP